MFVYASSDYNNTDDILLDKAAGDTVPDADGLSDFVHWLVLHIAIPSVSILGVVGNTFSIIVLKKHGLNKSSNILLFSLAISDITFMIGVNGPPKLIYEWSRGRYLYPETEARILFYGYNFFHILNWGSGPTSLCIPVFITVERFLAVFFPLKFNLLVTPRRTVIAVIIPHIIFYGIQLYVRAWFKFIYVFDPSLNMTVGKSIRSDLYWNQRDASEMIAYVYNCLIVFVFVVGSGCVAIGIKIRLAAVKRLKMTSAEGGKTGDTGTSRTTKTLLVLCIFYTVVCSFVTLPALVPELMIFPLFTDNPNFRSLGVFVYHFFDLVLCINASCNFVIYVAMNKKFRDTFLEILHIKKK